MSAYEEQMLRLNEKKINLAIEHAEEIHQLQKRKLLREIEQAEELHAVKMNTEKNKQCKCNYKL